MTRRFSALRRWLAGRSRAVIVLSLLAIVILVVVGSTVASNLTSSIRSRSGEPLFTRTPGGDRETENWRMFENEEDGFSVRYPPSWSTSSSVEGVPHWTLLTSPELQEETTGVKEGQKITIYSSATGSDTSSLDPQGDSDAPRLVSETDLSIDGLTVRVHRYQDVLGEVGEVTVAEIESNDRSHSIVCHSTANAKIDINEVCDLVIRSFLILE